MRKNLFEEESIKSTIVLASNSDLDADENGRNYEEPKEKRSSKSSEVSLNKKREEYDDYKKSLAARLNDQNKEWQNWVEMDFICSFPSDKTKNS